jgi:fibronectin type 3 domain-containing protein
MTTAPVQHTVSLAWRSSTDPKIISYSMCRSTIKGSSYGLLVNSVGTTIYSDQSVQPATIYCYVVTAVDGTGQESTYSNEIRASVPLASNARTRRR